MYRYNRSDPAPKDGDDWEPQGDRPRVLLVSPLPPPIGGIAQWTAKIESYSATSDLFVLRIVNSSIVGRSIHTRGPIARLVAGARQAIHVAAGVRREIGSFHPTVAHLATSGSIGVLRDLVVLALLRRSRIPAVYHLRYGRVPTVSDSAGVEWYLLKLAMKMACCVMTLDEETTRVVRSVSRFDKVLQVPNPVEIPNLPARVRAESTPSIVLFAGHVTENKGIRELLDAWDGCPKDGWVLQIAGSVSPTIADSLDSRAANDPSIVLLGELDRDAMNSKMAQSTILVLPSYTEGFPNVVAEAMAAGVAVIGTAVGAMPEMLSDGAGIVVPARESRPLQAALSSLMTDERTRNEIAEVASERARVQYAIEAVVSRYLKCWKSLGR